MFRQKLNLYYEKGIVKFLENSIKKILQIRIWMKITI